MRHRLSRFLVAAALAVAGGFQPHVAPPVAAVDCSTLHCAVVDLWLSGNDGAGRVTSDPAGIDCRWKQGTQEGTCIATFSWPKAVPTAEVTLTYDADPLSWTCTVNVSCSGLGGTLRETWTLYPSITVVSYGSFRPANYYIVEVNGDGDGDGRVTTNPSGIDCRLDNGTESGTCYASIAYAASYAIDLQFNPDADSQYCDHFGDCAPVDATRGVFLSGTTGPGIEYPVDFRLAHPILTVSKTGSGSITSSPSGISCGIDCGSYFPPGTSVKLTATPSSGYVLAGWTGACGGAGKTCTLELATADASTAVVFTKLATPTPTATPKPTPTIGPKPTPTARPATAASSPTATESAATPPAGATISPGSGPTGAPVPSGSSSPASFEPPGTTGTSQTAAAQASAAPVVSHEPASGPDSLLLALVVGLGVLLGLVLGGVVVYWLTRGRRGSGATPPRA